MNSTLTWRTATRWTVGIALALAIAAPAWAQQSRVYREGGAWVEETTGSLPAAKSLAIRLYIGNVNVQGGSQQSITYVMKKRVRAASEEEARRQFERFRFSASRNGDTAVLQSDAPGHWRYIAADLLVQAPRTLDLVNAQTSGGNETINGINGRVETQTGGGNTVLDDIGGSVLASSAGGNVQVGDVGSDITIKTGGGNIAIGSAKGRIITSSGGGNISIGSGAHMNVETGGGEIDIRRCNGELKAQSGGGTLDLGEILGKADLQTGGGSIKLASANGPVVASSGGGSIELLNLSQGAQAETAGGEIKAEFLGTQNFTGANLQTPAGDIVVYLDPALKATIKAYVDVAQGKAIHSDFPEVNVTTEGGQYGPKVYSANGNLNGGGPVLRLHTSTGTIRILRAKK